MNLVAPANSMLGYGHVGWNLLRFLHKKLDITFFPIGQIVPTSGQQEILNDTHYSTKDRLNKDTTTLVVWHEFALFEKALGSGKKIGLSFFELNKLDKLRQINLSSMDLNIQCSEWGANVLRSHGINNVVVIPCGYDPNIFHPLENRSRSFHFFNIGKMEYRKGHDILIKAFCKAFNKFDDVYLHMLWDNVFLNEQEKEWWRGQYRTSLMGERVVFHNRFNTDHELAAFIRSMHVGVFPTRAEGFGLPILQTLACGRRVITTDYSAQVDYCSPPTSSLLGITEYEPMQDGKFFTSKTMPEGATWGKLTDKHVDDLADLMREHYKKKLFTHSEDMSRYTWDNVVCELLPILS